MLLASDSNALEGYKTKFIFVYNISLASAQEQF
jgi:hypothetical protein